jgi:ATP-dependent Clp protease ATP-binding subunit ClpC
MPAGDRPDTESGHIPFTPRAKKVLELGLREALQLGHDFIGTEHLLLALIQEKDGLAGQTLRDLGVRLDAAREQVIARHPPEPVRSPVSPGADPPRAEVGSLRAEVTRLRDLLRRHGIDPDEDSSASTP